MNLHQVQDQEEDPSVLLLQLNSPRRQAAMSLSTYNESFRGKLKSKLLEQGVDNQSFSQLIRQGHVAAFMEDELQGTLSNGNSIHDKAITEEKGKKKRKSIDLLKQQFPIAARTNDDGSGGVAASENSLIKRRRKGALQIAVPDTAPRSSRRGRPPKYDASVPANAMGPPVAESPWVYSKNNLYDNIVSCSLF